MVEWLASDLGRRLRRGGSLVGEWRSFGGGPTGFWFLARHMGPEGDESEFTYREKRYNTI